MLDPGVPRPSDKGDFQRQVSSPELFAEEPKRGEWMARFARVIAVGIPHHITQRGNARRFILQDEADRRVYLDLLRQSTEQHGVHCQLARLSGCRHCRVPIDSDSP